MRVTSRVVLLLTTLGGFVMAESPKELSFQIVLNEKTIQVRVSNQEDFSKITEGLGKRFVFPKSMFGVTFLSPDKPGSQEALAHLVVSLKGLVDARGHEEPKNLKQYQAEIRALQILRERVAVNWAENEVRLGHAKTISELDDLVFKKMALELAPGKLAHIVFPKDKTPAAPVDEHSGGLLSD